MRPITPSYQPNPYRALIAHLTPGQSATVKHVNGHADRQAYQRIAAAARGLWGQGGYTMGFGRPGETVVQRLAPPLAVPKGSSLHTVAVNVTTTGMATHPPK